MIMFWTVSDKTTKPKLNSLSFWEMQFLSLYAYLLSYLSVKYQAIEMASLAWQKYWEQSKTANLALSISKKH